MVWISFLYFEMERVRRRTGELMLCCVWDGGEKIHFCFDLKLMDELF